MKLETKFNMTTDENGKHQELQTELEYIGKVIIKLEGFIDLAKEVGKYIDEEGKIYFELIETYMKKFALDLKNVNSKQIKK